ncbi:HNH endonuclease [Pseudomonas protegens]
MTAEIARDLFNYDEGAGLLTWKRSRGRAIAGVQVGALHHTGYWHTYIGKKTYLVHRIIWLMSYGEWPEGQIDHVDGNPQNNRIENLRSVSNQQNSRNRRLKVSNKSGVPGVYWEKRSGRWCAQISTSNGRKHIGYFDSISGAAQARKSAERKHGYHANNGRPAVHPSGAEPCV